MSLFGLLALGYVEARAWVVGEVGVWLVGFLPFRWWFALYCCRNALVVGYVVCVHLD